MRRPRSTPRTLLSPALSLALIFACSDRDAPTTGDGPRSASLQIPESWQTVRRVTGHRAHVEKEKVPCAKCHEFSPQGVGAVNPTRCAVCHERESQLEHSGAVARATFGPGVHSDCRLCHAFKPDPGAAVAAAGGAGQPSLAPGPEQCIRCHRQPLGDTAAIATHATADCRGCHRVHEQPAPVPANCSSCHDVRTTHASRGVDAVHVCTTCHKNPHEPASAAKQDCAGCHSDAARGAPLVPASAVFEAGHKECTSCHRAHAFSRSEARACTSCHSVAVIGGHTVTAHQNCKSCHAPHEVRESPRQACAGCHRDVHPDHPSRAGAPCTGCHEPHPSSAAHGSSKACSSCHAAASSDHAFHEQVPCTTCHAPHRFSLQGSPPSVCSDCHAEQLSKTETLPAHARCAGCHRGLPHQPKEPRAECGSCHAERVMQANPGHAACLNCHEPHGGTIAQGCATCHAGQQHSAPAGHQRCTACHEPHSGAPQKNCQSCHADEARSAHGRAAASCTSCHKPHGPPESAVRAPACSNCHRPAELPGLHRIARHDTCTSCHGGHDNPKSIPRSVCVGCHADRERHFPEAARCTTCHLFSRAQ